MSPTSWILRESDWLKPQTMDTRGLYDPGFRDELLKDPHAVPRRIRPMLEAGIRENSLVLWDLESLVRLRSELAGLHERQSDAPSVARRLSTGLGRAQEDVQAAFSRTIGRAGASGIGIDLTNGLLLELDGNLRNVDGPLQRWLRLEGLKSRWSDENRNFQRYFHQSPGTEWFKGMTERTGTIYDDSALSQGITLGSGFTPSWPMEYFADLESSRPRAARFLAETFLHPEAPLFVVNQNTRGLGKFAETKADYLWRSRELVASIKRSHPRANILFAPPEPAYGARIRKALTEGIVGRRCPDCALLPESKDLWPALLHRAAGVITLDSGFTHVANIYNPNVFVYSLIDSEGDAAYWRKPGQNHEESARRWPLQRLGDWLQHRAADHCLGEGLAGAVAGTVREPR